VVLYIGQLTSNNVELEDADTYVVERERETTLLPAPTGQPMASLGFVLGEAEDRQGRGQ
jgi:hypothetical protein